MQIKMVTEGLEPRAVWEIFENLIAKTPRASKKEEKIRQNIKKWLVDQNAAHDFNFRIFEDQAGNLCVKKPASAGLDLVPPIILQAHMDMVCESDRDGGFDFDHQPISVRIQPNREWLEAVGTTLGADNGIGLALILALLTDQDSHFIHGPIEALFTVDEETGLTGAFKLEPVALALRGKYLINVDSEDINKITIGSAGGGDIELSREYQYEPANLALKFFQLKVRGLLGGHSGVDIHLPRANANKILARCLAGLLEGIDVYVSSWRGGDKHNAIPREAEALFAVPTDKAPMAEIVLKTCAEQISAYYCKDGGGKLSFEPGIEIDLTLAPSSEVFSVADSYNIIAFGNTLPHGYLRMSPLIPGLVETSANFAVARCGPKKSEFLLSCRSIIDSELAALRRSIVGMAQIAGWNVKLLPTYPGWRTDPYSPFLGYIKDQYQEVVKNDVQVEAIHAGLETGIIGGKIPGIQMVSIGPTIKSPHSPLEKVKIADVGILYMVLKKCILNFSRAGIFPP